MIAAQEFELRYLTQVAIAACRVQRDQFTQIRDRIGALTIRRRMLCEKLQRRGVLRIHVRGLCTEGHGTRLVAVPRLPARHPQPAGWRLCIIGLAHQIADEALDQRRCGFTLRASRARRRSLRADALEKFSIHFQPLRIAAAHRIRAQIRGLRLRTLREHSAQFAQQQQGLTRLRHEAHHGLRLRDRRGDFAMSLEVLRDEHPAARLLGLCLVTAQQTSQHGTRVIVFPL